jgi:hypothetical protein
MGAEMLRRWLAGGLTLGLLFCGATVSLEALGVLFHAGAPDPQQRIDAFVARLEADLSPVDLPTEPVEGVHALAQEPPAHAGLVSSADPAQEGGGVGKASEVADRAEADDHSDGRLSIALVSPIPSARSHAAAQPDEVTPSLESLAPAAVLLPTAQAPSAASAATRPGRRAPGAGRPAAVLGPTGYAAFGWPLLDLLIW